MAKKAAKKSEAGGYVVFARRFRPQSFADVVGQETVTAALRHALRTGRLAQAYLLAGPRGVGKTSLARILAKALNCEKGKCPGGVADEPCNECEACAAIQNGSALDVIEMDAATNRGIADVQKLRENVGLAPSQFRCKLYIVDEVHMLTTEAWNAFLKTLEEPPAHVRFVFATTDPDKIPETILSRCQRFDLRRIGLKDIVKRLEQICEVEDLEAETGALERIAALAKGGLRDAEGLLDQAVNLGEGKVDAEVVRRISGAAPDELLFALLHACADGTVGEALHQAGQAIENGADPADLVEELSDRLRAALVAKTCGLETALLEGQSHLKPELEKLTAKLNEDQLLMLLQLFTQARRQVRDAAQARLPLEMAIVRAARANELVDVGKLVAALESGAAPGVPGARPGTRPNVREGPRPNALGRPAGIEARPAALPAAQLRSAEAPAAVAPGQPPQWEALLAAVRVLPGGGLIATALRHAHAKLDVETGRCELAFTVAQGFYRESLERPERLEALKEELAKVCGREVAVSFARAESAALPAMPAPARPEPRRVAQEVAFDDEGALPFQEPAAPVARDAEEGGAAAPPAAEELEAMLAPREEQLDAGTVREHPLVKVLVERVDGEIRRVYRRNAARKQREA